MQMKPEEWDKVQSSYAPEYWMSQHYRQAQRKEGQLLHKVLNERGIKVQLKGSNNSRNQMVIGVAKKHFLLIDALHNKDKFEPFYILSSERDGSDQAVVWERREQVIQELQSAIDKVTEPQKITKAEERAIAEKHDVTARTQELEKRFGMKINFVGG